MMKVTRIHSRVAVAAGAGLVLVLAGCSSKAQPAPAGPDSDLKTGAGISGNTINLGVVSDTTGPFAPLSTDHNRGVELYWEEVNDAGGVCDRFAVDLDFRDHGYNVQNAVSMYTQLSPEVLGFQDFVGGSHTSAILDQAESESRVIFPSSATQALAQSEVVFLPAALYNVDIEITIAYMIEHGLITAGDTVASTYLEGDYGEAGLAGVKAAAEVHHLKVLEYKVKASDSDMTASVMDAVQKGATAIIASTVPGQTASIASVLQSQGLDLPIGGSWPSYAASLVATPAGEYLTEHFVAGSSVTTYETKAGADLYRRLEAAYPGETITSQAAMGYVSSYVMNQLLTVACEAGDLTPEGVVKARARLEPMDADGLAPVLAYTNVGESPTRESFIVRFDASVPGHLRTVSDGPYTSADVVG